MNNQQQQPTAFSKELQNQDRNEALIGGGRSGRAGSNSGSGGGNSGSGGGNSGSGGGNSGSGGGNSGSGGGNSGSGGGNSGSGGGNSDSVQNERILNAIRSDVKETDWKMQQAIDEAIVKQDFPETLDLREDDWWDIGNQGTSGSCVGWASTDGVLRWHLVKADRIKKEDKLSVRFTWMASKETDKFTAYPETFLEHSGTPLKAALEVMRRYGMVHEAVFPFEHGFVRDNHNKDSFYELAAKLKIKGYYCLQYNETANLDHFKMWLTHQGPILALVDMDKNFMNHHNGKTVIDYGEAIVEESKSHGVAIVGYTKDSFIIRNSWGKEYGDNGYAYVSNEYMKKGFCEAYGIVV